MHRPFFGRYVSVVISHKSASSGTLTAIYGVKLWLGKALLTQVNQLNSVPLTTIYPFVDMTRDIGRTESQFQAAVYMATNSSMSESSFSANQKKNIVLTARFSTTSLVCNHLSTQPSWKVR